MITLKPRYAKNVRATLAMMSEKGGYPLNARVVEVDVDERHGNEHREDGEQDDHDQRLGPIHDSRAHKLIAAMATTITVVKTLSHHAEASSPTKSDVA